MTTLNSHCQLPTEPINVKLPPAKLKVFEEVHSMYYILILQNYVCFLSLQPKAPSPAPPAATSPLNINTKESAASHGSSASTPPITPPTAASVAAPTASSSSPSVLSVMPVVQSGPAVAAPPAASVSMKEVVDSIAVSHTAQPAATSTPVNNFTIH